MLDLDRANHIAHRECHVAESHLVAGEHNILLQRKRLAGAEDGGAVARAAVRQEQRTVLRQPDFGVNAAHGIVRDRHVAVRVSSDGESPGHEVETGYYSEERRPGWRRARTTRPYSTFSNQLLRLVW